METKMNQPGTKFNIDDYVEWDNRFYRIIGIIVAPNMNSYAPGTSVFYHIVDIDSNDNNFEVPEASEDDLKPVSKETLSMIGLLYEKR